MTKEECAKMCEANGCSDACKEKCMSQYDENGKYIGEAAHEHGPNCNHDKEIKDIKVIKTKVADGKVKATVTLTTTVNGKETLEEKVFEGSEIEVDAKIAALGK